MKVNPADPAAIAAAASDILRTHAIMVLATSDLDNQPWAVPVHQTTLPDGRITWISEHTSRHSHNLADNPKVSVTLYTTGGENGEISLFIDGTARVVEDESELANIIKLRHRNPAKPEPPTKVFLGDAKARLYALTPTAGWISDEDHIKVAIDLSLLS